MFTKQRFIYALIAISSLLIILNILAEIFNKPTENELSSISKTQIENVVAITLNQFGISNDWIKKIPVRKKLSDSLNYYFEVSVPKDISIANLVKEINKSLIISPVKIETQEKVNYGNTILKIFSNDILMLQANLTQSEEAIREFSQYSFLVKIYDNGEEIPLESLNRVFFDFTYLIIPSKINVELKSKFEKPYAVLLNDEITETDYLLDEDFEKQKLVNNIRSIIIDFGIETKYLIDEKSELFASKTFNFIRDEFDRRKIQLIPLQNFPEIIGNSDSEFVSLFKFYTTSLKGKEAKAFVVDFNNFLSLQPAIELQLKMGDKIVGVQY